MKHTNKTYTIVLSALFTITTLTSCAQMFQSKLPMGLDSNTTLDDLFESKSEITQLETPKQVFVSQGQSPTQILISWDSVQEATSYTIERAIVKDPTITTIPDEGEFQIIKKFVYNTKYVDEVLSAQEANYQSEAYSNNYKYYYRIIAQNPRKAYDPSLPTEPVYGTLFNPVLKLNADLGKSTDSINIYWEEVPNATSYQIWRGVNSNGTGMEKIATAYPTFDAVSNKLIYKNKIDPSEQGTEFYYKVIPVNIDGIESINSPIAMGFSLMSGAPSSPKNVRVINGRGSKNSIEITWDTVTADGEVKYTIYRTSSVDSSLTQLVSGQTSNTFVDSKSLKQNIYYYYQIQAFTIDEAENKLKSPMSNSGADSETPAEGFILSVPDTIKVQRSREGIFLSWKPALGNTIEQSSYTYNIYASANEKEGYVICDENIQNQLQDDGFIKIQVSQTAEFYKISTVYNETESSLSNAVAPSPNAVESISVSQNANLGFSDAEANANGIHPVKVQWTAPQDTNSLYGYLVYRSTKPDSGFRKITETPITTECFFIDKNETAKTKTFYYYKVLTVNSIEQGTEYSETKYGYGALTPEQYMREYNKTAMNSQTKLTLMHKSNDLDKLGSETISADISINGKKGSLTPRFDQI